LVKLTRFPPKAVAATKGGRRMRRINRLKLSRLTKADAPLTEDKVGGTTCAGHLDASGRKRSPQQMPGGINAAVREADGCDKWGNLPH
jgi:hypothetical protein